jgi:hypothetical protein
MNNLNQKYFELLSQLKSLGEKMSEYKYKVKCRSCGKITYGHINFYDPDELKKWLIKHRYTGLALFCDCEPDMNVICDILAFYIEENE